MDTRSLARRSHLHPEDGFTVCIKVRPPQEARGAPEAALRPRSREAHEDRCAWTKPQEATGVCASGRSSHSSAILPRPPPSPRYRRAHLVRLPAGYPRRPAGARSSEPGLSASSPATWFPPLPAPRSDSPAPAPGKVWRLPGGSVRWRRPRGWREHAEAGAGEEPPRGPPNTSPGAPSPAQLPPPRPESWQSAAPGQRPGTSRKPGDSLPPLPPHMQPEAPRAADHTQIRRCRQDASQIQPQVEGGRQERDQKV